MSVTTLLITLLPFLLGRVLAAPQVEGGASNTTVLPPSSPPPAAPTSSGIPHTGPTYYLRTCVVPGQDESKSKYESLYIWSYHTGAGLGDAVASASRERFADPAFLNSSYQLWDLGNPFPWYLRLDAPAPYTAWADVQINAAIPGQAVFKLNDTGLVVDEQLAAGSYASAWRGWISKFTFRPSCLYMTLYVLLWCRIVVYHWKLTSL